MQTRHPLSNLKTRAQAAFRFTYSPPFDAADDNETTARDCSVACMCNVKPSGWPFYGCTVPVVDVWDPCQCDHCTSYLNKRSYCTAPRGHGHIQAGYIPLTILEGLRLRPMGPEPGPLTFLRYKHPLIRRVNMREVGEKIAAVQSLERKPCTNS